MLVTCEYMTVTHKTLDWSLCLAAVMRPGWGHRYDILPPQYDTLDNTGFDSWYGLTPHSFIWRSTKIWWLGLLIRVVLKWCWVCVICWMTLTGDSRDTQRRNLSLCHTLHHTSHVDWSRNEVRPPQWQASD